LVNSYWFLLPEELAASIIRVEESRKSTNLTSLDGVVRQKASNLDDLVNADDRSLL
jgi:hypothetical protein